MKEKITKEKVYLIRVNETTHKKLKIFVAKAGMRLNEFVDAAINEKLKNTKPTNN